MTKYGYYGGLLAVAGAIRPVRCFSETSECQKHTEITRVQLHEQLPYSNQTADFEYPKKFTSKVMESSKKINHGFRALHQRSNSVFAPRRYITDIFRIFIREQCSFVHLIAYEFRYQGNLFMTKCYVCEQLMDVH